MTIKQYAIRSLPLATSAAMLLSGKSYAQTGGIQGGITAAQTSEEPAELTTVIQNVINVLLFIVGVAAVIMLIVGGIRYVVSGGDQQAVTNAKNTIMYAIVGIIVAIVAFALVQYVYSQLSV